MSWLQLYLRSRSVPVALTAAVGCAVALWLLGTTTDDPGVRSTFGLLAVLSGTAAAAPGLAGADLDLDRTAAFAWFPRRAAHVILASAAVIAITAVTHPGPVARDATGMAGLVALGAATLGASRAALLPVAWTLVVMPYTAPLGSPPTGPTYKVMLTWMSQPASTTAATVTAVLLGAAGTLTYAVLGARR